MSETRRTFMQQSLAAAAVATTKPWLEAGDLVAKMEWMNPPAAVTYGTGTVIARTRPRTDFWRKTFYGYITDNGHFYSIPLFGEFTFQARVNGNYAALSTTRRVSWCASMKNTG